MKRKILIEKTDGQYRTYFLQNEEIVEIHCSPADEASEHRHRLGDIYIGKVKNIVPNIGAAFIEIGNGISCYYDMKETSHAVFTSKVGKKPLCIGDELVVQISREAVKTKAPTVTSNLNFTGRYAVLTHGNTRIGVSSKLPRSLRDDFKKQLSGWHNDEFGIIIRTNAKDADFSDVIAEIEALQSDYLALLAAAPSRLCFSCLKSSPPEYITDLRNVYMDGMQSIVVEGKELYEKVRSYFETELPSKASLVELYDNPSFPLRKLYGTETVLEKALHEKVWLKNGGYLIIQPTEALTVIDVNSGKNIGKAKNEEGIMKMNLEAAAEAAKQIRLRNLSGIILIDFINLEQKENICTLLREFRSLLAEDPVQTTLVDITPLNLVEITRKKVHRPLAEQVNLKTFHLQVTAEEI